MSLILGIYYHKEIFEDLKDKKTCYFQCEAHAKKYIERCKFKKKDYTILFKEDTK